MCPFLCYFWKKSVNHDSKYPVYQAFWPTVISPSPWQDPAFYSWENSLNFSGHVQWTSPLFMEKSTINGLFSIAMRVITRGYTIVYPMIIPWNPMKSPLKIAMFDIRGSITPTVRPGPDHRCHPLPGTVPGTPKSLTRSSWKPKPRRPKRGSTEAPLVGATETFWGVSRAEIPVEL